MRHPEPSGRGRGSSGLEVVVIEPRRETPARNRTNAAWLRTQLAALRDDLLRAEVYGGPALTSAEIRRRLVAMLEGRQP